MKPIMFSFIVLIGVTPCLPGSITDSICNTVNNILHKYGRDSIEIKYCIDDILSPVNIADSGWDSTVHNAWIYGMNCNCNLVVDLKCVGNNLYGFTIESKTHHRDTTSISGRSIELDSGQLLFLGSFSTYLNKSGDTLESIGSTELDLGGGLGSVTHNAIYIDGIRVDLRLAKVTYDTIIYKDTSGNQCSCVQISSIGIGARGPNFDCLFHQTKKEQNRTIHCTILPEQCLSDTEKLMIHEIKNVISNFSFNIKRFTDDKSYVIFRTAADCKRYAREGRKKDKSAPETILRNR